MSERSRKLIAGETEIYSGLMSAGKDGTKVTCHLYFGNLNLTEDGRKGSVAENQYRKKLARFLHTEEGLQYAVPTPEEINQAHDLVRAKYRSPVQEEKSREKAQEIPEPAVIESAPEQETVLPQEKEVSRVPEPECEQEEISESQIPESEEIRDKPEEEPEPAVPAEPVAVNMLHESEQDSKAPDHSVQTERNSAVKESAAVKILIEPGPDPKDHPVNENPDSGRDSGKVIPEPEIRTEIKYIYPKAYGIRMTLLRLLAYGSFLAAVLMGLCLFGIIPNMNPAYSEPVQYRVVQLASDIPAGSVIQESDLTEIYITADEYRDMCDSMTIRADGTSSRDKPLLWDNRINAVGKFAMESMRTGSFLKTGSYSDIREEETVITIDTDGKKVSVPLHVTAAGTSDIRFFAIVTTVTAAGESSSVAVPLGTFSLEGRSLQDVISAEGNSVLEQFMGLQGE